MKKTSKATWPTEDGQTGRTKVCDTIFQNVASKHATFKVSSGKSEQRYSLARVTGTGTIFYLRRNKRQVYRLCKLHEPTFATESSDPSKIETTLVEALAKDQQINK